MSTDYSKFTMEQKSKELERIRSDLGDLANSLAGEDTGGIAALIHQAASGLINPQKYLDERVISGVTPKQASDEAMAEFGRKQMVQMFSSFPGNF